MPRQFKRNSRGQFMYNGQLTQQQIQAIKLLVYDGVNNASKVAEHIGVCKQTVYNWLSNDEFNKEFKKQKAAYIKGLSAKALANIEKLMDSKDSRTALAANKAVLKQCQDFTDDIQVTTNQEITITLVGDDE